ncbi:TIGR02444 family protein [Stella sp.]|uniref:TIGR02444 family protein n=1 Tax=Stella sp. TaxID=2912054 RepID=UPI0035B10B0D
MTAHESLWDFSMRVYGAPGVADWCLALQDGHGADVNVLLWAAWWGAAGLALAATDLAAAEGATGAWRDQVVRPLRAVRRALRADIGAVTAEAAVALRIRIKAVELEAERLQQAALEALRPAGERQGRTDPGIAIAANLGACLDRLGAGPAEPPPALIAAATAPLGTSNGKSRR